MSMSFVNRFVTHQLDKLVLYTINRRVPGSIENSYLGAPTFETVLAQTEVDSTRTVESQLSAPGEQPVWLRTMDGDLSCRIRVRLAVDPEAPLLLYHHGLNEVPYTNSWRRIFRRSQPFPAHLVCIQAPFHSNWDDPLRKGFASLQNMYQMFAGSLRIMERVQSHFEAVGVEDTIVAGVSWGGITSLLYEGVFQRCRAVIPMLSSPNLAQVMWDIANLFNRPVPMSQEQLGKLLDFTPYYQQCAPDQLFPLLGEEDQFFRLKSHASVFRELPLVTIPNGHITGSWNAARLRRHVLDVLEQL